MVTIIIPTYNRKSYLEDAIDSVLGQNFTHFGIIVVDDGSDDGTADLVRGLGDPKKLEYMRFSHSGVPGKVRNAGARMAKGNYLAFLDSDDQWEPEKLEIQLAVMQQGDPIRWCITNLKIIDLDASTSRHLQGFEALFPLFKEISISAKVFFSKSLKEVSVEVGGKAILIFSGDMFEPLFHGNFCSPVSLLIHRELWDIFGGFDESFQVAEDTEFFHRLASKAPGAIVMTPLIRVRRGHVSLISPINTIQLIQNTLISIDRAVSSRQTLTTSEQFAYVEGKQRLLSRLAWAHLTNFDGGKARKIISTLTPPWRRSIRIMTIYTASFLPAPILRYLHKLKQFLRKVVHVIRLVI
ncbi:MAG TPA: glycosyltransferase family 2 protein [Desulfosporosinus sp.]|nr:glycosyltransferase family 2 protein [Desulfosporosinus sp.]